MDMRPVIVVHGGAWAIPDHLAESSTNGVKNAVTRGFSILANGGNSLQAVEATVRILEDNIAFDAGHGAVLNADGDVELDAIIMDGTNLAVGAVSCIKSIANPVMFARTIMEQTPHVMLTGSGANKFAEKMNIKKVPAEELVTENAVKEWEQYQKYKQSVTSLFNTERMHDTVGAVAIDHKGNIACATSTGGITNKMVGRVGDSPIIGSGAYADNFIGAVSTTGHGESIMKVMLARKVLFNMEKGETPQSAADQALEYMKNKVQGRGGLIVVSKSGEWAARFTTKRMAWASIANNILNYGLNPGENFQEKFDLNM
ncbi:isoaspartyl peptidase/L-asparaginase-like [Hyla sarda]|uniref:isoaspartyl peptidase/L-asparaginase-like n=1 Tax=Hyla sarda TaxID=327740 RepID=UPI0024C21F1F|nr:isoaspartyl peptidase/L-asparaginase-like [Hyla sarda]XP_056421778.1 isoaspartyl peptidase/L-asparaginase-like [Hyla sarda]XP_056421779.1 isoaspartyl peptidase/L-asparaginase-like [Hyla sarda]XP_056421780.1 isoaspartyl peptidase/L-asparaginase-like [Hyla sarda]